MTDQQRPNALLLPLDLWQEVRDAIGDAPLPGKVGQKLLNRLENLQPVTVGPGAQSAERDPDAPPAADVEGSRQLQPVEDVPQA